jgi:hypothetical protein
MLDRWWSALTRSNLNSGERPHSGVAAGVDWTEYRTAGRNNTVDRWTDKSIASRRTVTRRVALLDRGDPSGGRMMTIVGDRLVGTFE